MRLPFVYALVLTLASPLAAGSPGAEFELGIPNYSSAPFRQAVPSLASDGSGYFAVWEDSRIGSGMQTIYGARVSAEGQPLDPVGIRISAEYGGNPRAVFAGGNYLVAWQTYDAVAVARVAPDGTLLDAQPKKPLQSPFAYFSGALATNGSVAVIGWRREGTMVATVLDAMGESVRTIEFPTAASDEYDREILVTWNGSAFVIARVFTKSLSGGSTLAYVSFMRPDGEITSTFKTPPLMTDGMFSLAALPDRVLFVSGTFMSGHEAWMFTDSGVQWGDMIPLALNAQGDSPFSLVTDDDSFVAIWTDRQQQPHVNALRIDRDGITSPDPIVIATVPRYSFGSAVAKSASGFLAAWSNASANPYELDVVGRVLQPSLAPAGAETTVSLAASAEDRPVVGWNGSAWLAIWQENRGNAGRRLVARRLAPSGAPLDPEPLELADLSLLPYAAVQLSVASDGRDFAIVWREESKLLLRRLGGNGGWLDAEPRVVVSDARDLSDRAIAWDGNRYFLVYSGFWTVGVAGVQMNPAGDASPGIPISPAPTDATDAVVARLGEGWLVAWTHFPPFPCQVTCPGGDSDILGSRVTFGGTLLDTAPIQFSLVHSDYGPWDYARRPSIGSAGNTALVTWLAEGELRGVRISRDGAMEGSPDGNGTRLLDARPYPYRSRIVATAWEGHDFLVLSSEANGISSEASVTLYRMPAAGPVAPLESGEEISRGSAMLQYDAFGGAIFARPNGGALLVYPRIVFGAPYGGVNRLFGRTIAGRPRTRAIARGLHSNEIAP